MASPNDRFWHRYEARLHSSRLQLQLKYNKLIKQKLYFEYETKFHLKIKSKQVKPMPNDVINSMIGLPTWWLLMWWHR